MPTYEYECTKCRHLFERFQSITAEPVKRCPKCRAKVRRLLGTGAGIIFKGSGFYQTDYRSSGYREAERKDKTSASTPTSSSSTAKESKKDDSAGKVKDSKKSNK